MNERAWQVRCRHPAMHIEPRRVGRFENRFGASYLAGRTTRHDQEAVSFQSRLVVDSRSIEMQATEKPKRPKNQHRRAKSAPDAPSTIPGVSVISASATDQKCRYGGDQHSTHFPTLPSAMDMARGPLHERDSFLVQAFRRGATSQSR